ncbi:MAG: helix-turn-helix domain-containing protein, partial [Proteobacteria bacterium]|nr:helix-turn-helix domain-containing protein [Pseudomonadota bacterium]
MSSPDQMKSSHRYTARRVDIVVYPGFKALEAIGTMSVFEYANVHLARQGRPRGYELAIASTRAGIVPSDMLMSLTATKGVFDGPVPDIAIVVGAREIERALAGNTDLVQWLSTVAPQIDRLVALCSGSFFFAAAHLLDGQRATTHWSVAGLLGERYPQIDVEADAIYLKVKSGRVWTSAGVTACIDLALALVEEDFGRDIALEVARDLVVYLKRPGGQSQYSVHLASQHTSHPGIQKVQDWILSNLDRQLSLPEMAQRASMSERNFRRVFCKESGSSPLEFVELARLDAARRLLEDGDLPLKSIAGRVGFASEQSLRKLFTKHLGVAPLEYRLRFGGESAQSPAPASA